MIHGRLNMDDGRFFIGKNKHSLPKAFTGDHFLILLTLKFFYLTFMVLSSNSCVMKTMTFIYRNIYLIFLTAFLSNGVLSYSQQTANQKAQFGLHSGFYFPEQKIKLYQTSDDTSACFPDNTAAWNALNRIFIPRLTWESIDDSSTFKFNDPLCRMPQYSASELQSMHKQQDLMWEQYYRGWQKQVKMELYSIDLEGWVRGSIK